MPKSGESIGWSWDRSLYAGSAAHYVLGRVAYPPALADALQAELRLDGSGTLLDVGCGPGSLTLLLAPLVRTAIGLDADPDMLAEADRLARERGIGNVVWRELRAEDLGPDRLPAGAVPVQLVTLAQSFHWMDRPRVAAVLHDLLEPTGALVHVSATTHQGDPSGADPAPPWTEIEQLVAAYLGPRRRAGQGERPAERDDENTVYQATGFVHVRELQVPARVVRRGVGEVRSAVYSLSWAAPHLFGERLSAFDADLVGLLERSAPSGSFTEQLAPIRLDVWRPRARQVSTTP